VCVCISVEESVRVEERLLHQWRTLHLQHRRLRVPRRWNGAELVEGNQRRTE